VAASRKAGVAVDFLHEACEVAGGIDVPHGLVIGSKGIAVTPRWFGRDQGRAGVLRCGEVSVFDAVERGDNRFRRPNGRLRIEILGGGARDREMQGRKGACANDSHANCLSVYWSCCRN
jgi:hypothetical protein